MRSALLVPPQKTPTYTLALDPGQRTGIKTSIIDPQGQLLDHKKALHTVHFLGSKEKEAMRTMCALLEAVKDASGSDDPVCVALGNGTGTNEAQRLIKAASAQSDIPIDLNIIDEAGVSVWSATKAAADEFPGRQPSAIGAISIGRKLQDPMNELVKVPPKSLGLGMYQHDLPEGDLNKKLTAAVVDTVALVGADLNSCSLEVMRNIPGLSKGKLAENVISNRPFRSREQLKEIKGVGPKAFEQSAGFLYLREEDASNDLDTTRCHPESYAIVVGMFKDLGCTLKTFNKDKLHEKMKEDPAFAKRVKDEGIEPIVDILLDTGDPRFQSSSTQVATKDIPSLSSELSQDLVALQSACPIRRISGVIRNIADFGCFIDIGTKSAGLMHNSMMGSEGRSGLAVGVTIAVDVLEASPETGRITLARAGNGLDVKNSISRGGGSASSKTNDKRKSGTEAAKRKQTVSKKQRRS